MTKTSRFHLILVLIVLAAAAGCDSVSDNRPVLKLTDLEKQVAVHGNAFSFRILKTELVAHPGKNVTVSPLSISGALGLTANGATGETQAQMMSVLGLSSISQDDANAAYKNLFNQLPGLDPDVDVGVANSIWYKEGFPVKDSFLEVGRSFFDARVESLDFDSPGSPDVINKWVRNATAGRIQKMIDSIPSNARLYILNALYFKGQWSKTFDRDETKLLDFHVNPDQTNQTETMVQVARIPFLRRPNFSAVELSYGNGNYSMLVILPDAGVSPDGVLEALGESYWTGWADEMNQELVSVLLPRFTFQFETKLNETLVKLGMPRAFSDSAEFSGISEASDLFISSVLHKTFIEVNEQGTEAAAVTSVEISTTSINPDLPISFHVNRPFLFIIRENSSGTVLFCGRVTDPRQT